MCVIKVFDGKIPPSEGGTAAEGGEDGENEPGEADGMEGIAAMFGGKEIIRNSVELVEAAFDGGMCVPHHAFYGAHSHGSAGWVPQLAVDPLNSLPFW